DGIEVKIIDQTHEEITDLPPCQPQFLPNTKQEQTYINLRNRRNYLYLTDMDDEEKIEIVDAETNLLLDGDADVRVPLIGEDVAWIPITTTEHFETTVNLPKDWIIDQNHTFALRVTGDSMIDAGIDEVGTVIVHRQVAVSNNDIVIAVIGEEATMKKYMSMGS